MIKICTGCGEKATSKMLAEQLMAHRKALNAASNVLECIEQTADQALMGEWDRGDDGFNCMIDLIREWREKHDIPNETTKKGGNK